jgi:hypothetical protein
MTMSHDNSDNVSATQCCSEGKTMAVELRAWVDDNDIICAKQICPGAVIAELRGVLRNHALH